MKKYVLVSCGSRGIQAYGVRADMMSIGIGIAANISMKENRRVNLDEFYKE